MATLLVPGHSAEIITDTTPNTAGRPLVVAPPGMRSPHVSIAHAGDLVIACASMSPCGIDIEHCSAGTALLEARHHAFSPRERRTLDSLIGRFRQDDACARAVQLWTRKEALVKAVGTGFLDAAVAPSVLDVRPDVVPLQGRSWRLSSIDVGTDYQATLATPAHVAVEVTALSPSATGEAVWP